MLLTVVTKNYSAFLKLYYVLISNKLTQMSCCNGDKYNMIIDDEKISEVEPLIGEFKRMPNIDDVYTRTV